MAAALGHGGDAVPHRLALGGVRHGDDVHADGQIGARADALARRFYAGGVPGHPRHIGTALLGARDDIGGVFHANDFREAVAILQDEGSDAASHIDQHAAALGNLRSGDIALDLIGGFLAGDVADILLECLRELVPFLAIHAHLRIERITASRFGAWLQTSWEPGKRKPRLV